MASKQTTFKVGRDARDGRFETVDKARRILLTTLLKRSNGHHHSRHKASSC